MAARMACLAAGAGKSPIEALLPSVVLIAGVLVLGVLLLLARRLYVKWQQPAETESFSIEKLEKLRDDGQISPEEFARLRKLALGLVGLEREKEKSQSSITANVDDEKGGVQDG